MEVYKSETKEVLSRFLAHKLSFAECIAALDAALAGFVSTVRANQLGELRALMLTNVDIVMKEMHQREVQRKANFKSRRKAQAPKT